MRAREYRNGAGPGGHLDELPIARPTVAVARQVFHDELTSVLLGMRMYLPGGLPLVTLAGLATSLGAGIYVLVGKVAGFTGSSTTLAFVVAMITAAVTALSYVELAGRYTVSVSVSVYLHRAFGKRWLPTTVGLTMVGDAVTSAAALPRASRGT